MAGHDTTGYQMAWIIIEVSKHPEILQKIREELDPLIPDDMKEFTPKMLGQMHYLSMVIKEGMRLWPVLPIGSNRVCRKDFTYKEYFIPKGATLGKSITGYIYVRCFLPLLFSFYLHLFPYLLMSAVVYVLVH